MLACLVTLALARVESGVPVRQRQRATARRLNVLTPAEKAEGWTLLFDGTSTAGWHGYNKQELAAWAIEDCALKTVGVAGNYGSDKRADLVTDREFTNFELRFDWKASKGGNSGVMYGVVEDPKYDAAWKTGPEYQLIDDVGFHMKVEPDRTAGVELLDARARSGAEGAEARRRMEHDAPRRPRLTRRALVEREEGARVRALDTRSGTRCAIPASGRRRPTTARRRPATS